MVVDGQRVVGREIELQDAARGGLRQQHVLGGARGDREAAARPGLAADAGVEHDLARRPSVVAHVDGRRRVGRAMERRRAHGDGRDREIVVGAPDLHVVEACARLGIEPARFGGEVREDRDPRAGTLAGEAARELEGGREIGRRVVGSERLERRAQDGAIVGPAQCHGRARPGGDDEHVVGRSERRDARGGTAARLGEAAAALLHHLHARRDVEHEHERRSGRGRCDAFQDGPQQGEDQRRQREQLQPKQRLRPETLTLARRARNLLPEEERADGNRPPSAVVEIEQDEHRDRRERDDPTPVREADQIHRRRTNPCAARSPAMKAARSVPAT